MIAGREFGSKVGSGGQATKQQEDLVRKERLKQLALETADLKNDPFLMKNHIGRYECKLCCTHHPTPENYLVHTQGKKHQNNLAKRAAKEKERAARQPLPQPAQTAPIPGSQRRTVKIGRPGYKVLKQIDPDTSQRSLTFEVYYPEIQEGLQPRQRMMSAYEQKVEAPDKNFQYILFAAEPYETIAFKIPNEDIDKDRFSTDWDRDNKTFTCVLPFKVERPQYAHALKRQREMPAPQGLGSQF
eukprot:GCRY01003174.1.p1 GENE.GCRY01003174.1~~GCRY01003174.1.p1  ORF type:complete len:243 (+),score=34.47 GCRY01003174.1:67-795(+)